MEKWEGCIQSYEILNHATLCGFPEKPNGITEEGAKYYKAENARPLSISNADNRLIANACRLRWDREPRLDRSSHMGTKRVPPRAVHDT